MDRAEQTGHIGAGWRAAVPTRFRTGYAPRDRWLTREEYAALYRALPAERRIWLVAAVYLGGRESELRALTWRSVDLATGFVTLLTAKAKHGQAQKPRHIPIADELRAALEAVPESERRGPLLPCWCNGALMVARYAQKAGIVAAPVYERVPSARGTKRGALQTPGECLSPNDLRRSAATWLVERGAPSNLVGSLLGHTSSRMVERVYGRVEGAALGRALIAAAHLSQPIRKTAARGGLGKTVKKRRKP
jgi:integrase